MKKKLIEIMIVEDHEMVLTALKTLIELEEGFHIEDEAQNGFEAIKLSKERAYDLIIMDIAMPGMNGIEASKQILGHRPDQNILILSAHGDDSYIEKIIELGINGYLVKQCAANILIDAIIQTSNGKEYYCPKILDRYLLINKQIIDHKGEILSQKTRLTSREIQVLQLIAEGNPNKMIAHLLKISIKTVEKHRQNLMKKLYIHDTAGLTRYAIEEGITESSIQRTTL